MNNNGNWDNLGEEFVGTVADALATGDFSRLNTLVNDAADCVVSEARRQADAVKQYRREHVQQQSENWKARQHGEVPPTAYRPVQNSAPNPPHVNSPAEIVREMKRLAKVRNVGDAAGTVCAVFGGLGLGITVLTLLLTLLLQVATGGGLGWLIFSGALGIGSVLLLRYGLRKNARANRIEQYLKGCGYKMYGQVEDLARLVGKSVKYVRRDLRRLLRDGVFPEGHLDAQESCLMLNDAVYNQYLQLEEHHREASAQQSLSGQVDEERRRRENELNAIMSEGMEYIRKVRDLNDQIPDEKISAQMYEMEGLLKEIFNALKQHPDQQHRMRKLMEYYLPTTIKLLEGYRDFNKVSAPGKDIIEAKAEIEKTLDHINQAYREILNSLFRDEAWDVATDAQVLRSMLASEGLTRGMEPEPVPAQTKE